MTSANLARTVDALDLEQRVKQMYTDVAQRPDGRFHFEMGRVMAERLGYPAAELDAVPEDAVRSFAGVGYYFDLAELRPGEDVVDLGSGSGMDAFLAARSVAPGGHVTGIDMTDAQLQKAERLRDEAGLDALRFRQAYIEQTGLPDACCDAVISNGVINLAPDKPAVFREAARLLRPGGRLAISDIVTVTHLPSEISCDATLWAACIGGAMQCDDYVDAIEQAGLTVRLMRENREYRFLSKSAQGATRTYGVMSVSLLATRD